MKIALLTITALCAFAANSVLCRLALGTGSIDAASFTIIRLSSGVVMLMLILCVRDRKLPRGRGGGWFAAAMLFLYAIAFSFAYLTLQTGTGALILFGAVQITMILYSWSTGTRLRLGEWLGLLLAFVGFVYLVAPGISAPPLEGFLLMSVAGVG